MKGTSDCMPTAELSGFHILTDVQRWPVGTNVGFQNAPLLREHHVRRGLQKSTGLNIIGHRKGESHAIQGRLEERDRVMCSYMGLRRYVEHAGGGGVMQKWWAILDSNQ